MKKILSLTLTILLIILSVFCMGVSAQVTNNQSGIVDDSITSNEAVIYFEVPDNWTDYSNIYCFIWEYNGDLLAYWQTKKTVCTETDTPGLYAFDITNVGELKDDTMYCVIFITDTQQQTYDCLMDKNCFGDTLYTDGTNYISPQGSKNILMAYWKNQDSSIYGPILQITSIGDIIGTAIAPDKTAESLLVNFIEKNLYSAVEYTAKTEEEIISNLATKLNITEEKLAEIIAPTPFDEFLLGDANTDGIVNVKDATFIQKCLAGIIDFPESDEVEVAYYNSKDNGYLTYRSDFNLDGVRNIKDATAIQKHIAGIEY